MLKHFTGWIEGIWKAFCPPKRKRLEVRFVTWDVADKMIRESNGGWTVAPEEDKNKVFGVVYLERLEPYSTFSKESK